jgi:hypothetical protein
MHVSKTSARRWFTAVVLIGAATQFYSCDWRHSNSGEEDEILTIQQGVTCGVERWSVKTGTDADIGSVNLSPQDTTIAALTSIARPSSLPPNNRASPAERQAWRLRDITLTIYKLETDSDYHLVLSDGSRTMITEIPHPDCVGGSSPFLPGIQAARATFDSRYTPTTSFQTANVTASLVGVGFFDFFHGQTGVAANGIELHAVLGVCFGAGCQIGGTTDDFSIGVNPASQTVIAPGSTSYTVSTAVTSGNPQPLNLTTTGLPSGINAAFNPPSINSGGSSTLTLTVGSGASPGTVPFTITATGPSATHSTSASITVINGATGIVNGDFESGDLTGWTVIAGSVIATSVGPHSGNWAAQIGSTSPLTGDSTLVQTIAVPITGTNTLSFWYNPHCTDTLQYDWQDAQVQDTSGRVLINMLHVCENTGTWTQVTADLTPYNGTNVNLVFTDHDDGAPGDPTYYLLDDVALISGSGGPPATSITSPAAGAVLSGTVNVTAVGSAQPPATLARIDIFVDGALLGSGTASPTMVAWNTTAVADGPHALTSVAYDSAGANTTSSAVNVTVANAAAQELIVNGGFENGVSPWYRGGVRWPTVSTAQAHTGSYSLQCGGVAGQPEPNGDSWADQQVQIPSGVSRATLSFWYYAASTDTIQYDWQDAQVRNTSNVVLINIFHMCDNSQVWTQRTVDLTAYRGQTVRIYFNAHGDGYGDLTTLWIDDVSLTVQ